MKKNIKNIFITLLIIIILGETFVLAKVIINDGYYQSNLSERLLRRMGISVPIREDLSLVSWGTSLEYLEYDADVVFIGDSITRWHNWQKDYPDKKVIELGISGDTLSGINKRVYMLGHVNPKMVFINGGINGLKDFNINEQANVYEDIIRNMIDTVPSAKIYVQSTLPLGIKADGRCSNNSIIKFNSKLEDLCKKYSINYVDLHSLYFHDGYLKQEFTKDGVHLTEEGYKPWVKELRKLIY